VYFIFFEGRVVSILFFLNKEVFIVVIFVVFWLLFLNNKEAFLGDPEQAKQII